MPVTDRDSAPSILEREPNVARPWSPLAQCALIALLALATGLLALQAYHANAVSSRPLQIMENARVDLNRASRAELALLPGVGEALAQRIVESRRQGGGFRSVNDLLRVDGVGPKKIERLRPWVKVVATEPIRREQAYPQRDESNPASGDSVRRNATTRAAANRIGFGEPINVSTASAAELQRIPGIGPVLAARIVETRTVTPFRSVDDLINVRRIGPKTLAKIRPYLYVGPAQ